MSRRVKYSNGSAIVSSDVDDNSPLGLLSTEAERRSVFGLDLYVDTVNGSNSNDGRTFNAAKLTMAAAFAAVTDHSRIYVVGDVREELLTPLGVQGVKIISGAGGNTRHDDGCRWRQPASGATTGGALLTIREQGWEVHGVLFVPKSDGTALRLRRAEDATYPDGSHAIISRCKFIGDATATTIGIEDHGGSHHDRIIECEFFTLNYGIKSTAGAGIAAPLRWVIRDCIFGGGNSNHLVLPGNDCLIQDNVFLDDAGTKNVDTSGATGKNVVVGNYFATAEASIANSNGYTGNAADSQWRNFSNNTAAHTVGVPGA